MRADGLREGAIINSSCSASGATGLPAGLDLHRASEVGGRTGCVRGPPEHHHPVSFLASCMCRASGFSLPVYEF
jgi:hypothetical protein